MSYTVGVVGAAGNVGSQVMMALAHQQAITGIIGVDADHVRLEKIMLRDMRPGALSLDHKPSFVAGPYKALAETDLVIVVAGDNELNGGGLTDRLHLLKKNAGIIGEVMTNVLEHVPESTRIIIVTNPPEPLALLASMMAGVGKDRVFTSGTMLDSERFRIALATRLGICPTLVRARVIGEHGNRRIFLWSSAQYQCDTTQVLCAVGDVVDPHIAKAVEDEVARANATIISGPGGIGASKFGIGIICGRIARAFAQKHAGFELILGRYMLEHGAVLSLPLTFSHDGSIVTEMPVMNDTERDALKALARAQQKVISPYLP